MEGEFNFVFKMYRFADVVSSFIYGWKDQYGKPDGLFQAAQDTNEDNIIYVRNIIPNDQNVLKGC